MKKSGILILKYWPSSNKLKVAFWYLAELCFCFKHWFDLQKMLPELGKKHYDHATHAMLTLKSGLS